MEIIGYTAGRQINVNTDCVQDVSSVGTVGVMENY